MSKPECDFIKGIPPAIAIEQKVNSRNPRSTVGTSTEIYEYMRLLFARIGRTFSPVSGEEGKKHSVEDIVNCMLQYPEGTRYMVLTRILLREGRSLKQQLEIDLKQGFNRIEVNGETVRMEEYEPKENDEVYLLVDRMTAGSSKDAISRLTDSAETAMYEGEVCACCVFTCPTARHVCIRSVPNLKSTASSLRNRTTRCFRLTLPLEPAPNARVSVK
jgi:excinuclease ABC subunit A